MNKFKFCSAVLYTINIIHNILIQLDKADEFLTILKVILRHLIKV